MKRLIFIFTALLLISSSSAVIFDDFEDSSLDATKWISQNRSNGDTMVETGGKFRITKNEGVPGDGSSNLTSIVDIFGGYSNISYEIDYFADDIQFNRQVYVRFANSSGNEVIIGNISGKYGVSTVANKIGYAWKNNNNGTYWFSLDGTTPASYYLGTGNIYIKFQVNSVPGVSSAYLYVSNVSRIGTTPDMNISLLTPTNGQTINDIGRNFTINATINRYNLNFTNVTYYVWYSYGTLQNATTIPMTGNYSNSTTLFMDNFTIGDYKWNAQVCGKNSTTHLCYFSSTNYTFSVGVLTNYITYNNNASETSYQTFTQSISSFVNSTVSYARFIYDGKQYSSDFFATGGNNYTLNTSIDIPLTDATSNKTFYWNLNLVNDDGSIVVYNTSSYQQTVNSINLTRCGATYSTMGINYTIYNESSLGLIQATFKSTAYYYLGTGTVRKNNSFNFAANDTFNLCLYPNATFTVSNQIKLVSAGFDDRTFSFNKQSYNNTRSDVKLYMLSSVDSSTIILEWKDKGLTALPGYLLQVLRYYPENNNYLVVHQDNTDNFGVVVSSLIENSVKYKFKFYNENNTLIKTTNDVTVACRSSICLITFVDDSFVNDFERFDNVSDYEYSLVFNNDTNTFIYSWDDYSGDSPFHRLTVTRIGSNGTIVICNSSSTALIGSLTCAVGSNEASYNAQAFRSASPEKRIALLSIKVGGEDAGTEGLLWSFILLMSLIMIGIWNPPAGVGFYLAGFFILAKIGLIYINPAILIAEIALGVAFIWAFRS